jgi:hypothetical protein
MKSLSKTKKKSVRRRSKKGANIKKKSSLCAIDDWSCMNDFLDFIHIRKKHHPENFLKNIVPMV